MKHLLGFILLMAVLVAAVTGCGGAHRYDGRLMAADSLMHDNPDSALAIIQAVCPDSLTNEGDRAYRDLLLTQARYKCYIVATSDSDINRALAYYRQHKGEREKLTRAYIYKGAVMGELNCIDSAMFYFKQAEAVADSKDYVNLGQINTRIADLYRRYYADEQVCFEKYKKALHYYQLTDNKPMQQNSLFNMAISTSISAADDSREYLFQSLELASALKDSSRIFACRELLCRSYLAAKTNSYKAKQIALNCLNDFSQFVNKDLLLDLASIYVNENNTDSATVFLDALNDAGIILTGQSLARKYQIQSMIAEKNGDVRLSKAFSDSCSHISDSIACNEHKYQIQRIENDNVSQQTAQKNLRIHSLRWLLIILVLVFTIIMSFVAYYHYMRIRQIKAIIRELKTTSVNKHENLLEQMGAKDSVLEGFIKNIVTFMHTSIDASENDPPAVIRKRIRETVGEVVANDDFWTQLYVYLDKNHNNIISSISQNPKINESDKRFIALSGCGFSYIEMSVILDYSPNYISNKRKKIIRKLGLKTTFQDYLNNVMN